MSRVLIAGCGDLGSGLAESLIDMGHHVVGIRRTGSQFPEGVVGVTGDLREFSEGQLPDVEVIFLIMTPKGRTEEAYRLAYFDTAQALVRRYQYQATQPQVFFVSSTSVYGQSQGQWIDESTLAEPKSATAKVLRETEDALAQAFSFCTSIRCSGIYGAGRFRLIEKVKSEQEWETNSWTNRIHRDDVVSALVTLAKHAINNTALPPVVIATDLTPVSMWEVKLWLATSLGAKPTIQNNSGFVPDTGKRIQGQHLLNLGWQPRYPSYVVGYQSLLEEYKHQSVK
ncbi:NAD-dependent epimerase/dehydratase family protein [Marinomonas sp. C2222]|uniref:NAD-dependent epimerase/dehydratase family protein n=1 Tax=Marinomonas sargassi TaxID=2984494 RepID=A0ABT2YQC2_9GAMM|nr:NAD-dependent epimerase/dehydratase family protein [Marinomonas sargassi]MCV2402088.1 NAD-dependent epimerase/dehydratase family protein [Marinomonas sargassi]